MQTIGLFIGIGCAFLIASIYFYFTYKNIIKYSDSDISEINRNLKMKNIN